MLETKINRGCNDWNMCMHGWVILSFWREMKCNINQYYCLISPNIAVKFSFPSFSIHTRLTGKTAAKIKKKRFNFSMGHVVFVWVWHIIWSINDNTTKRKRQRDTVDAQSPMAPLLVRTQGHWAGWFGGDRAIDITNLRGSIL